MYKLTMKLGNQNSASDHAECIRQLRQIADDLEESLPSSYHHGVRDINGNMVGKVEFDYRN
jgi:hypothetical protein